ncbi:MAG: Abi family protein [Clostridia bacterium]|nr:Abi family protein [Clostridia bacterium]
MKKFTTYEEQIKILKERNLIIDNEESFKDTLKDCGYYNLINGYSFIFQDSNTNMYLNSASVKDIQALYTFDKNLRNIIYKYAMTFESRFKSIVSYVFSKYHGEDEKKYLIRENFDKDIRKEAKIAKLISDCNNIIKECSDKKSRRFRNYIYHYVTNHGHVPLWVLIRAMTMGDISVFYANMRLEEKTEVANEYNLTPSQLEIMVKMLVSFRNTVAHDEHIFCKRLSKDKLPYTLEVYDIMRIKKNDKGYPLSGTCDFLSLMIIFKYLLKPLEFAGFWTEFTIEREDILIKNIKSHFVAFINNEMGLKNRWKNLQNCRINPKILSN